MTAEQLQALLIDLLEEHAAESGTIERIRSFADADLLTRDTGLLVSDGDGSEFQVTIVRSR